jgi:glycosyltransferase involved in cell wall biosynthesis/GR25 family glycosyltransferase involved in LPS biosynthesis
MTARRIARIIAAEMGDRVRLAPLEGERAGDLALVSQGERDAVWDLLRRPPIAADPKIVLFLHYPIAVPKERGDRLIALFMWEEFPVASEHVAMLNEHFDAIVTTARFVVKILVDSGIRIPIHLIGLSPDLTDLLSIRQRRRLPPRDHEPFCFLHVSACVPRKGLDALLIAYALAFRRGDNVRLVIKGLPNAFNIPATMIARMRDADPDLPDIVVIDQLIDRTRMLELYESADAVVLPTRGEGFNLPAAEALAAGLKLIVTGYSGHLDFCNAGNCRLLDYRFAPSRAFRHNSLAAVWADPDPADLAAALREAIGPQEEASPARADAATRALLDHMSPRRFVRRLFAAGEATLRAPRGPINLRIAWISSWTSQCAIACYSQRLIANLPLQPSCHVTVLGETHKATDCPDTSDAARDSRCGTALGPSWSPEGGDAPAAITAGVAAAAPDVVVIQHHPRLLQAGDLVALLQNLASHRRTVVATLHDVACLEEMPADAWHEAMPALRGAARLVVHTIGDLNRLKRLGLIDNVTMMPSPAPNIPTMPHVPRPRLRGLPWVIGCTGALLPSAGVAELIAATCLLRRDGTDVRLKLVNTLVDQPDSMPYLRRCRAVATSTGLDDIIEWHHDELDDVSSAHLLGACDIIAVPTLEPSPEADAAVRLALCAGPPVIVTPQAAFETFGSAVERLPGYDPAALASGVHAFWRDLETRIATTTAARIWRDGHRPWDIATRFGGMLAGLHQQAKMAARRRADRLNVHVINLATDTARLARVTTALQQYPQLSVQRIEGVSGRSLPDDVCLAMTGDPNAIRAKGALGCFLSHVRAWEAIIDGDVPFAMVLEDDIALRDWSGFFGSELPEDFDIIFCNDRTELAEPPRAGPWFGFHPIARSLPAIEARRMAVGGDCYILSREGAATLLNAVRTDRYFSHVDLRMLAYALDPESLEANLPQGSMFDEISEIHRIAPRFAALTGYSLYPALADHVIGPSSRDREDRLGRCESSER